MEHWLDQPDTPEPGPDHARRRAAPPPLHASMLAESTRRELDAVTAALVRDLAGNGPRRTDPRVGVLVAEAARAMLTQPLDDEQRRQALECVAEGTPLYTLSARIGKSHSTLAKRWNPTQFNHDLAPLAWLRQHEQQWAQACLDAAAEARTSSQTTQGRHGWPVLALVSSLEHAATDSHAGWRRLRDTPRTARTLLTALPQTHTRARQDRPPPGPPDRHDHDDKLAAEPAAGPALQRLGALLAQYDTAPTPPRRGGAHPARPPRHTNPTVATGPTVPTANPRAGQ
jgi:hypothetical protein